MSPKVFSLFVLYVLHIQHVNFISASSSNLPSHKLDSSYNDDDGEAWEIPVYSDNEDEDSDQKKPVRYDNFKHPSFPDDRDVIVHLVDWTYKQIAEECSKLHDMGYAAVQVSPVTAFANSKDHSWDQRLSVISYDFHNESGSASELEQMIEVCNKNKIKIFVDVVINNMAKSTDVDKKGVAFEKMVYKYEDGRTIYVESDFHDELCDIKPEDYLTNLDKVWTCRLSGRQDLKQVDDQGRPVKQILDLLRDLMYLGVSGFRMLTADHINPEHLHKIYEWLPRKPFFIYNDVYDPMRKESANHVVHSDEYTVMTRVSDYSYARLLAKTFSWRKTKLAEMYKLSDTLGLLSSSDSVVFINNFITLALGNTGVGEPSIEGKFIHPGDPHANKAVMLATAFMLTNNHGIPLITSSFSYDKVKGKKDHKNEHTWSTITHMVGFRRVLKKHNKGVIPLPGNIQKGRDFQAAFCVGTTGFVAINNEEHEQPFEKEVDTCFDKEGLYCDVFGGGLNTGNDVKSSPCKGKSMKVTAGGKKGELKMSNDEGFAAFHIDAVAA